MRIKNIAAKVIGVAGVDLRPGSDWKEIDDRKVYVDLYDEYGKPTGKKQVLPSLQLLQKMNQIVYVEAPKDEPQSSDGAPAGNGGDGETGDEGEENEAPASPELTDEEKKKAEAAAKRAATRAANKAAAEAAKAAAGKAE